MQHIVFNFTPPQYSPELNGMRLPWNAYYSTLYSDIVIALRNSNVTYDLVRVQSIEELEYESLRIPKTTIISNFYPKSEPDRLRLIELWNRVPFITISGGYFTEHANYVALSDARAMEEVVSYLKIEGYLKIGYLSNSIETRAALRFAGWQAAMKHRGLYIDSANILRNETDTKAPQTTYRKLFDFPYIEDFLKSRIGKINALVCDNDSVAYRAFEACRNIGIVVPDDLAVTGIDGIIKRENEIDLTTILVDTRRIAKEAVKLAIHLGETMDTLSRTWLRIPPKLHIGKSAVNPHNPIKFRTSEFLDSVNTLINDNIDDLDLTSRIALSLGFSRSYFLKRFKNLVGLNFSQYLLDFRLKFATTQICETDKTVMQISIDSGFSTIRHFNRAFLSKYGASPSEYRAKKNHKTSPLGSKGL